MRFLSVRELRNEPGKVWEHVQGTELVLTAKGKPVAILVGVEEDELEQTLALLGRARAQAAVSRLRTRAAETGGNALSPSELEAEVAGARSKRSRR